MSTTAIHRALARACANALRWNEAVYHLRQAIALYPGGSEHKAGSLAAHDIAHLEHLAEGYQASADAEGQPAWGGAWASGGYSRVDPEF